MLNGNMRVLIACEESQEMCKAFRELGAECYSCDIQECSGGHPEWHIKNDAIKVMKSQQWDLIIAHPPCTYLTRAGACNIPKDSSRIDKGFIAKDFFMEFVNYAESTKTPMLIENPIPMKRFGLPPYTQLLYAWQFGEKHNKPFCFWEYNIPKIKPPISIKPQIELYKWVNSKTGKIMTMSKWYVKCNGKDHSKKRSKTSPLVAKIVSEQLFSYIKELNNEN